MTWAKAGRFVEFLRFDGLLAVCLDCRLFDKYFMYIGQILDSRSSTFHDRVPTDP